MRLFDFIEKQNAMLVLRKNVPEAFGATGFIAHEQLHIVQVKELGHIEAENVVAAEKIAVKFKR